jgi:hypothetical protein
MFNIFKKPEDKPRLSDQEYENYMAGYRIGHPVKDDPATMPKPEDAATNEQFQRGLKLGKDAFKRGGSVLW